MEAPCAIKVAKHLLKNNGYYYHNANDRFGLNIGIVKGCFKNEAALYVC
jgi:hypothetical protein